MDRSAAENFRQLDSARDIPYVGQQLNFIRNAHGIEIGVVCSITVSG
jgi:hypothetical protein